jgi:hypothetical protein
MLHYNQAARIYGVSGAHYVAIYYGPLFPKEKGAPIAYPGYPYHVEVEGLTYHHYFEEFSTFDKNLSTRAVFPPHV